MKTFEFEIQELLSRIIEVEAKNEDENGWKHQSIILKPLSTDNSYENIVLEDEDLTTFKAIETFECVLE